MARTAILIPSLGRSQYVMRVWGNIEANTPEPHKQFWCVAGVEYEERLLECSNVAWMRDDESGDKRYVTRMNKLVQLIQREGGFEYIFFGSDDVVHHPGWLSNALKVFDAEPTAQVVVVNDLRNPNGTQAVIKVEYLQLAVFDDPGAAFHHGYQHNFADTEMFVTASERGVIFRALDSHVEHLHPLHRGGNQRPWDKTYADAQSQWDVDAKLFNERIAKMLGVLHGEDALSR